MRRGAIQASSKRVSRPLALPLQVAGRPGNPVFFLFTGGMSGRPRLGSAPRARIVTEGWGRAFPGGGDSLRHPVEKAGQVGLGENQAPTRVASRNRGGLAGGRGKRP